MAEQKLPLTPQLRENYIRAVHKIWPDTVGRYKASHVNEEVARIMDNVLNEIAECSKSMALIHELFEDFYMPFKLNKWRKIIMETIDVYVDWLDALEENRVYRSCVVGASRNWKSPMSLALEGY